ncbi:FHA domain-containing protein [Desulfococcaceae bacterium HSG7]|nr:FHA domain-containing protein [Desulfococcaceae bacterium HSG7]
MKLKLKPVYFFCLLCLFAMLTACSEKALGDQSIMLAVVAGIVILIVGVVLLITLRKPKIPIETYSQWHRHQPEITTGRPGNTKKSSKSEGWHLTGVSGCGEAIFTFDIETLREHPAGLTLGRDPALCQLVIDNDSVSVQHARIGLSSDELTIEDLNSSNGTAINRDWLKRSYEAVPLVEGAEITLGEAILKLTRASFKKTKK